MRKIAVLLMGPPGSGKGTQAKLLADRKQLVHFDTGSFLESVIKDPDNKNNAAIQIQRKAFNKGDLINPAWVLKIVRDRIAKLAAADASVILSGSPRTLFETFGDQKNEGLMATLSKLYGRDHIFSVWFKLNPSESIKRNSARLICSTCHLPIMGTRKFKLKECPLCAGRLVKRGRIDTPTVIKNRLREYLDRTQPIKNAVRKAGFIVFEMDASPLPYQIHERLMRRLK